MSVPEHAVHYLEIVTPDVDATCHLYGTAYGWHFEGMRAELGNAFVATLPDGGLCGVRAPMHEQETPTVRTYLEWPILKQPSTRPRNWARSSHWSPPRFRGMERSPSI